MPPPKDPRPDLHAAYALSGPEAARALYRSWAGTYDVDFVAARGYAFGATVARLFLERAGPGDAPLLDIGAGTGVVGTALAAGGYDGAMTALDLSPEMLERAADKGVYAATLVADLTGVLPLDSASFGALISAGTFTHGHVGPEALDELVRVAAPGALLALGINAEHYAARGFEAAFARLGGALAPPELVEVPIYAAEAVDDGHGADRAFVALTRRS